MRSAQNGRPLDLVLGFSGEEEWQEQTSELIPRHIVLSFMGSESTEFSPQFGASPHITPSSSVLKRKRDSPLGSPQHYSSYPPHQRARVRPADHTMASLRQAVPHPHLEMRAYLERIFGWSVG